MVGCAICVEPEFNRETLAKDLLDGELDGHKIMRLIMSGVSVAEVSNLTGLAERVIQDLVDSYEDIV